MTLVSNLRAIAKLGRAQIASSIVLGTNDDPPREFRLFRAGWNDTTKGRFLFDDVAAESVMAAAVEHGVDKMVDLEHLSLDPESRNFDPDARAWIKLEVRDGELWATDARWTEDGDHRLRSKKQRYVSPVFDFDPETMRILRVINVALTALPATYDTPHLVAASVRGRLSMNAEQVKAALDALIAGDTEAAAEILKGMVATAAGGDEEPPASTPEPEMMAEDVATSDEEAMTEVVAATARLCRLTERSTMGAALTEVESWRQSHLSLTAERAKIKRERLAIESAERTKLVTELVRVRAETSATAFSSGKLCQRLQDEPIESLRSRVAELTKAAHRGSLGGAGDSTGEPGSKTFTVGKHTIELSARELQACADANAKPEVYAANKIARSTRIGVTQ